MAHNPNEIHFDCPKCNRPMSGDKTLLGEMINCPDCGEPFIPTPKDPATGEYKSWTEYLASPESKKAAPTQPTPEQVAAAAKLNAAQLAQLDSRRVEAIASHAEKIHNQADRFTTAAALFLAFGLMVALVSVFICISGDSGVSGVSLGGGFTVAASLIGASLWIYLIAQVIHIRANTER